MKKKNLLFITADQWRWECLSILNHQVVKTPNLDALAADGVLFGNHFAQCTPCGPSRASLYTGMYLQNHRSVENGVPLDGRHTNLALELRKLGYDPTLVGYTDTSPDPRQHASGDPVLNTYEGILPGFNQVLAMPSEDAPHVWGRWLQAHGFDLPQDLRDIYYGQVKNYPGAEDRGVTYAPALYGADASSTAFVNDLALNFLRLPGPSPWFLHISYLAPHPPYVAPEPYHRMYHPDEVPDFIKAPSQQEESSQHPYLAFLLEQNAKGHWGSHRYPRDDKTMRQLRATYYGMMTEVDDAIGKVIDLLKQNGQYEDTIIVFGSDHGDQLWDHHLLGKSVYFDQSFRIPLIIRAPGEKLKSSRGRIVNAFTENIDIVPTILDLLGADIPRQCDGKSLLPFLKGDAPSKWRREVHWEMDFRDVAGGLPEKALGIAFEECCFSVIRDERYKYVHFAALPPLFFDLKNDPAELRNLAGDPGYAQLILEYAQKMISWRMVNDERTLTHMLLGPGGVVERLPGPKLTL